MSDEKVRAAFDAVAMPPAIEVLAADDGFGVGLGSDILVVDDDQSTLVAYRAALEPLGRNVVTTKSGEDAIGKLLQAEYALILLDVRMPGMSGIETARLARMRPRNRQLPIIFITGEVASVQLVLEAYELGGSDFVSKPVMPEVLRAKVRVYLELQERTRALVDYARQLHDAQQRADETETLRRERELFAATARRLQKLQLATAQLARAKTPPEVAAITVRLGAEAVDARASALWVSSPEGSLSLVGQHGYPQAYLAPWVEVPAGEPIPIMQVFESGEGMWSEGERDYERIAPATYERARKFGYALSFAVLPLRVNGRRLGVLSLVFDSPHQFPSDERDFLTALVRACEQALERSQLYVEELASRRALEEAGRRRDELLAMLGHELRNPLAAMVSAFDLLKLKDASLPRELAIVQRQVGHLAQLVEGLVDVARVTRGAIALKREPTDVADALADALAIQKPLLDSYGHELSVMAPPGLVVDADRERFAQVVAQLVTNAAKYTPEKGRIQITAEPAGPAVKLSIRDNGAGISPELLQSLFEPFVQGERTLDRSQGGLGIGLTIVRTIVELHGGSVHADSDGVGRGATFTVLWPAIAS